VTDSDITVTTQKSLDEAIKAVGNSCAHLASLQTKL
jgi:hypothetical protein